MIDASVYIVACNEEHHLPRALASLRDFAEVIVVDSGSHDRTPEIAKSFPNVTYLQHPWECCAKQKQYALERCTREWALNLDADEEMTPELQAVIEQTIRDNAPDALCFPIDDIFLGHHFRSKKAKRKIRFFRRNLGTYNLTPTHFTHEQMVVRGTVRSVSAGLNHYGLVSIEKMVEKNNLYSSLKAKEKAVAGKRFSLLKLIAVFPLVMWKKLLLQGALFDGVPGLIAATTAAYYAFLKEAKLYELECRQAKGTGDE
ncbi:MAG: glycosyltransferase family 2 protein [Kiritimatiellia bacterium]